GAGQRRAAVGDGHSLSRAAGARRVGAQPLLPELSMRGLYTGLLATLLLAPAAWAQEGHFAVVDISAEGRNEKVTTQVEKEVSRLRPGSKPLDDPAMRRLLATGEGPAAAATRLTKEAEEQQAVGDCAGAVD